MKPEGRYAGHYLLSGAQVFEIIRCPECSRCFNLFEPDVEKFYKEGPGDPAFASEFLSEYIKCPKCLSDIRFEIHTQTCPGCQDVWGFYDHEFWQMKHFYRVSYCPCGMASGYGELGNLIAYSDELFYRKLDPGYAFEYSMFPVPHFDHVSDLDLYLYQESLKSLFPRGDRSSWGRYSISPGCVQSEAPERLSGRFPDREKNPKPMDDILKWRLLTEATAHYDDTF